MTQKTSLNKKSNRTIKRIFDIVVSAVALIGIALLLPFIAYKIKKESKGSIFFRQQRTGKNGKTFWCYKFRSMYINNEADLKQATMGDPRTFPFGSYMRRHNIDELPQFWNVLIGDMSIVGPRPHMLYHTKIYSQQIDNYMLRHTIKPGITGWAQITGYCGETKDTADMEERVKRDLWYIEHWTLRFDIQIIRTTIKNILSRKILTY